MSRLRPRGGPRSASWRSDSRDSQLVRRAHRWTTRSRDRDLETEAARDARLGLSHEEAAELGPLLLRSAAVVDELVKPDQVYTCLWSHAGGAPVHIHYVVQPATRELMARYDEYGPHLQVAMFDAEIYPPEDEVAAFAEQARAAFRS